MIISFVIFLGANSEHRKVAEELSRKTGIPLYDMPHIDEFVPYDLQFNAEHLYDIDSEQFVNLISLCKIYMYRLVPLYCFFNIAS